MYVIGTSGHVDHGKSTLVKALTSIDPDRLPEEKEREMTIDLGFAWMTLPSGREVSIVDVPGHERFIKNMLAGVGAIDLALLIVAADESVMPQTREHVAILDLLQINRCLVVITKADLVDAELVELVKAEVEDTLADTAFQGCPMLAVSSLTGAGIEELKAAIDGILDQTTSRRDLGRPRLPVDRCFSISGFGTVVTGTLIDGSLEVGQEVELVPSGLSCRVRGLQSHQSKIDYTGPGVRLAVNLSGAARNDIQRGQILTTPGWLRSTQRVDARLRMVRGAPHALRHNEGVTFHLFTCETPARVRMLEADQLPAGAEGWVQILLENPVPMVKGDFFILRSAEDTLGGGQVVDPNPRIRHRRHNPEVIAHLLTLDQGTGEDVLISLADQWGPCDLGALSRRANLPLAEVRQRVGQLAAAGDMVALGDLESEAEAVVYSRGGWSHLRNLTQTALSTHHREHPLRAGMPAQELRSRLGLAQPVYLRVLARAAREGLITVTEEGQHLRLPSHQVALTPPLEREAAAYLGALAQDPYSPPTDLPLDSELLGFLVDQGKVVKVNESVVFSAFAYQEIKDKIVAHLKANGRITVAEARTMLSTSRKYILPLLEHLDQQRITRRMGDERVLR